MMKKVNLIAVITIVSILSITCLLSQTAHADPVISVVPKSVTLGNIPIGDTSASKIVTITNKGASDLSIGSITITGTNASEFSQINNCTTLPAGVSCTVTIAFRPKIPFGKKSAVISIVSNDPKKSTVNVKLSGQAPPPKISAGPMSVNFGSIPVDGTSLPKTVKVKNTGISDLLINSVTITGANASDFRQTNDCSRIPAKSSCAFTVTFKPTMPFGKKSAVISINSNDPKKPTVNVKLSGQAPSSNMSPVISQVVNSAGLMPIIAPDSLASVIGKRLAEREAKADNVSDGDLPTELDGVSLEINGRFAGLISVSPERIAFRVPPDTEIGEAAITVRNSKHLAAYGAVKVQAVAPGLFFSDSIGYGPEYVSIINPAPIALSTSDDLDTLNPSHFAVYVTGISAVNIDDITIEVTDKVGNVSALNVESIEPVPGLPGMDKIYVLLPSNMTVPGNFEIKVTAESFESNREFFYLYTPSQSNLGKEYILSTTFDNDVFIKTGISNKDMITETISLLSTFSSDHVVLSLEPSGEFQSPVIVEIDYKDHPAFASNVTDEIEFYHFSSDGLLEPPRLIKVDQQNKIIRFEIDHFSTLFLGKINFFHKCVIGWLSLFPDKIIEGYKGCLVAEIDAIDNAYNSNQDVCLLMKDFIGVLITYDNILSLFLSLESKLLKLWDSGNGASHSPILIRQLEKDKTGYTLSDAAKERTQEQEVIGEILNSIENGMKNGILVDDCPTQQASTCNGREHSVNMISKFNMHTFGSWHFIDCVNGEAIIHWDMYAFGWDLVDFNPGPKNKFGPFYGSKEIRDDWFITYKSCPGSSAADYYIISDVKTYSFNSTYPTDGCKNDKDGDGIPDLEDPDDNDGPLGDLDGDGVLNKDDKCEGFDDNKDADNDNIPDGCDPCPLNPDPKCDVYNGDPTFIQFSRRANSNSKEPNSFAISKGLTAHISVPYEDALVRGDVPIFGTASGDKFKAYRVEFGEGKEPTQWTTLITSQKSQDKDNSASLLKSTADESIKGNLSTWNTGLREYVYLPSHPADDPVDLKGIYTVRLIVEGTDGSLAEDKVTVEVANVISNAWGGQAVSEDRLVSLSVPEQALMYSFRLISIKEAENSPAFSSSEQQIIGKVYEVREMNEQFTKPTTLQFSVPGVKESSLDPGQIGIYGYDTGAQKWVYLKSERLKDNNIVTDIKKLYPYYALMTSSRHGEGSVVKREPDNIDKKNIVTRNSSSRYLINNTFENSLGEWSNRDGEVGATVSIVDDATYDSTKALKITNSADVGNFAVNIISSPFDVREYPLVQFDYRISSDVKTNFLVKTAGKWYEIGFTGEKKDLQNKRVNIAHIGDVDTVMTNDKWHTARFNLYNMLRTKTGNTVIEEMIMANWDVSGYMRLNFGHNQKNAAYYIDNFIIARDLAAGLNADENMLLIDNFNQNKETNALGGSVTIFGDSKGGKLQAAFSTDDAKGKGNALELSYDLPNEDSYAGYVSHFQTFDLRDFKAITLQIKGVQEEQDLLIGLLDQEGNEHKLSVSSYVADKVNASWQLVSVPLVVFSDTIDLAKVNGLSLSFKHRSHSTGSVSIDDISFDKNIKSVIVDNFEQKGGDNLLGGKFYAFGYGDSAINSNKTRNSPNGVMKISYGGSIGQICGYDKGYNYAGWTTELKGIDCSQCDILSFRVKGSEGREHPNIYLSDGNFRWSVDIEKYVKLTTEWQNVIIPLKDFSSYGVDLTHLTELQILFEWEKMSGTIFVDDIQFGLTSHTEAN